MVHGSHVLRYTHRPICHRYYCTLNCEWQSSSSSASDSFFLWITALYKFLFVFVFSLCVSVCLSVCNALIFGSLVDHFRCAGISSEKYTGQFRISKSSGRGQGHRSKQVSINATLTICMSPPDVQRTDGRPQVDHKLSLCRKSVSGLDITLTFDLWPWRPFRQLVCRKFVPSFI